MRRTLAFLAILLFAIPAGVSLSGCGKSDPVSFCESNSGPKGGQTYNIDLEPKYYGKSLAFGQTTTFGTPTASDCNGQMTAIQAYKWGSSNPDLVDINPATGEICAGLWNRHTPGGVADYTTCTPGTGTGIAEIYASGGGATSNHVKVYVHPPVKAVTLGNPAATPGDCSTDPSTNCCPITNDSYVQAPAYDGHSCVSQRETAQIVARAYDTAGHNITCSVGHPTFEAVTGDLVKIDENGVATAQQPGTTLVRVTVSESTSEAGVFSVCPPKSITLTSTNASNGSVSINPNTTETLLTTILDTKNVPITGLNLTYTTTTPTTMNVASSGILASFPSTSSITALCEPPTCNPSPTKYLGLNNTGKPVASNPLLAHASGNSGTQMWVSSTDSKSIVPFDFVLNSVGAPVTLPYTPNSMVISQDGSTIYLGSDRALMVFNTGSNTLAAMDYRNLSVQGPVLAVSPNNATIVVTDPARKITQLYSPTAWAPVASFGGVARRAEYSPDSQYVYITMADDATSAPTKLVVYNGVNGTSTYDMSATGINDVAVTVPSVGAYIGGNSATVARSYCPNIAPPAPVDYYPVADSVPAGADRLVATNDGHHILGARVPVGGGVPALADINVNLPIGECPASGSPTFGSTLNSLSVAGVNASSITDVVPSSDAVTAFITYTAAGSPATPALLPAYRPVASGPGTLSFVTLANGATAPVAGVFTTTNNTFYVGTSGDNKVHAIDATTLQDTTQYDPKLPSVSGSGYATPNLIVQKPRKTT